MKPSRFHSSARLAALVVACSIAVLEEGFGQVADPPAPSAPTFDIDFPGGMLEDFVMELRGLSEDFPNIVIPDQSREISLPALTLRGVTLEDLTAVLATLGETDPNRPFNLSRTTDNTWIVLADPVPATGDGDAHGPERQAQQQALFFPISQHLESNSIADISTTIATAWELLRLSGEPSDHVKLHEETQILIATGDPRMLQVVEGALEALVSDARSNNERNLAGQLEQANNRLRMAQAEHDLQLQLAKEKAAAIEDDLRRALEQVRQENDKLRAQLRDLESHLSKAPPER